MNTSLLDSILVASDLDPSSEPVLRAAASLAERVGARLHVVHACDLPLLVYGNAAAGSSAVHQRIQYSLESLEAQIRHTVPASIQVASHEVHFGSPARTILQRAKQIEADLIVLGPHRHRPLGDLLLGSTADQVIRAAVVPCLIVRGELAVPLRRLMAPLDLSDPARAALDLALGWAMALAESPETAHGPAAEVQVLHVIPRIFGMETFPFDREVVGPELDREIQGAVMRTGAAAHVEVCEKIVWGDVPAEEILAVAEEARPDLIVMATHGHGAFLRALIGSVASQVARRASCSVLLVPPTGWAADEQTVETRSRAARSFAPPMAQL